MNLAKHLVIARIKSRVKEESNIWEQEGASQIKKVIMRKLKEFYKGEEWMVPSYLKNVFEHPSFKGENILPQRPKLFTPIARHVTPCSQVAAQSCTKEPCSLSEFRISSFLIKRLDRWFYDEFYYQLLQGKKPRGRPRLIKDVSEEALWKQVIGEFSRRANKRIGSQRIDARNTSMCRNFRRVVDYILKYVGSRCRYKSNKIEDYIESYAEAFTVGFVPIIFGGQSTLNKLKTFWEFIVLSYPASKVKTILGKWMDEGLLHESEYQSLMNQLKERKNSSMGNSKKLASENSWFERLLMKILSKLPLMNLNDEEGYKKVLEKVLNIELWEPVFWVWKNKYTTQKNHWLSWFLKITPNQQ